MTLIQLIEYAATLIGTGTSRKAVDLEFASMGIDIAVVEEILNMINDDGSYRRVELT